MIHSLQSVLFCKIIEKGVHWSMFYFFFLLILLGTEERKSSKFLEAVCFTSAFEKSPKRANL